jgi:hypothetical protein
MSIASLALSLVLSVYPQLGMAPMVVRIRASIEPNARNRGACLWLASDDYASESCWQLDGDKAARTTVRYFMLEGGDYLVGLDVKVEGAPEVHAPPEHIRVIPRD